MIFVILIASKQQLAASMRVGVPRASSCVAPRRSIHRSSWLQRVALSWVDGRGWMHRAQLRVHRILSPARRAEGERRAPGSGRAQAADPQASDPHPAVFQLGEGRTSLSRTARTRSPGSPANGPPARPQASRLHARRWVFSRGV